MFDSQHCINNKKIIKNINDITSIPLSDIIMA